MKNNISKTFLMFSLFFVVLVMLSCYKEPTYKSIIKCYYSKNGFSGDEPVDSCRLTIGLPTNADFAYREAVFTNHFGVYEDNFKYESLLDVDASKIRLVPDTTIIWLRDSIVNDSTTIHINDTTIIKVPHYYKGKGQLRLEPNKVSEISIYLIEEAK